MKHISEIIKQIKDKNSHWVEYERKEDARKIESINKQLKLNL
tara:strand:- start:896 stop:1021 length:126 start_codon:yes stop_codon:yes gene_type:complete